MALRDPSDDHHLAAAAINRGIADGDVWLHPVTFDAKLAAAATDHGLEIASA